MTSLRPIRLLCIKLKQVKKRSFQGLDSFSHSDHSQPQTLGQKIMLFDLSNAQEKTTWIRINWWYLLKSLIDLRSQNPYRPSFQMYIRILRFFRVKPLINIFMKNQIMFDFIKKINYFILKKLSYSSCYSLLEFPLKTWLLSSFLSFLNWKGWLRAQILSYHSF